MQDAADDAIAQTVDIGTIVVDCVHDLRNGPADHLSSGAAGDFIQDLNMSVDASCCQMAFVIDNAGRVDSSQRFLTLEK